ncbi:hypothetical protein O5559_26655, partial [Escherichia coli]|nr:hypothetical protein [Escherichia coli]
AISVTERQRYILRIRTLTKAVAEATAAAAAAKVFRSAPATNVLSRSRSRLIIGRFALII